MGVPVLLILIAILMSTKSSHADPAQRQGHIHSSLMTTVVCETSGMEKIAALRGGASHARRQGNMQDCGHKIQGIIDGQVVVTHSAMHTHHALQSTPTMVTHRLHGVRDGLDVQTHDFLVDLPTDSEAPRVFSSSHK